MRRSKSYSFDTVFTMALFCLFSVTALLLAAVGGGVYRRTKASFETDNALRTAMSYIAGKAQSDEVRSTEVRNIAGAEVIVFRENVGGAAYDTLIWFADGRVYEKTAPGADAPDLSGGEPILTLDSFACSLKDGRLLYVRAGAGGAFASESLAVNRFAGEAAA